jgi:hypothetical protein
MACMQLHPDRGAFPGLAALLLERNKYPVARIYDPGAAGHAAAGECRERAKALRKRAAALMTGAKSGDWSKFIMHVMLSHPPVLR